MLPPEYYNYTCSDKGLLLPILNEYTWSIGLRATLYFFGLIYCFLGVAIIADIFMCSIEKITSQTRKIRLSTQNPTEPEIIEVKVWNDTVANLTLMALGSSAPEILLSIIEVIGNGFKAGELGPGTIVGSAAFNLLIIIGVCIISITDGDTRRIKNIKVFGTTAFFSIFAYIWMLIILVANSPNEVELWEAVMTFILFPVCVILAYVADKDLCGIPKKIKNKQLELGFLTGSTDSKGQSEDKNRDFFREGKLDREQLIQFVKEVKKYPGMSDEDAAVLAASKLMSQQPRSRMWYRISAIRELSGTKKPRMRMSEKLREVYDTLQKEGETIGSLAPSPSMSTKMKNAIIEFNSASVAIMENAGKVTVLVIRKGNLSETVQVRIETLDGTATADEDYIPINQILTFRPNETEKEVSINIIDDNQWEPDEEFFLKLSLPPHESNKVILGRTSVMEVIILNDDQPGIVQFKKRGLLVQESIGMAHVPVVRKEGADGDISVKWRTIDKKAISGKDYVGGEGELHFKHGEMEMNVEIKIINDMKPEKDEHFEIELFEPTGGAQIGNINRTTVTITNDDDFDSVMSRLMMMTNANMDAIRVETETWAEQFQNAMNVNGGDVENATWQDYILHFLTFGWKVFFACVPPASMLGGWVCFFISLGMIGLLTAVIGDLAGIFGCLVGLPDSITAITFVAAGTSLPDLFASKTAAKQEKHADSAVGNVTGSNSVNVFLGLGLPWFIASVYWFSKGETFKVEAGDLGFSVACYTVVAILSIVLLLCRRFLPFFGKAELGGPKLPKWFSCIFMWSLWVIYVLLSSLQALDIIKI